jgi:hypothetical protein
VWHLNVGERIPHPLCQRSHVVAFFDDDHVLLFVQNGANGTDYHGCPCSEGLQELGFDGGKKRGGGSEGGTISRRELCDCPLASRGPEDKERRGTGRRSQRDTQTQPKPSREIPQTI